MAEGNQRIGISVIDFLMIGCQSEAREGDGYTGSPINWRIFVRQPGSLKRRLKGRAPSPKVEEIALAVVSVLEEARFRVVLAEA